LVKREKKKIGIKEKIKKIKREREKKEKRRKKIAEGARLKGSSLEGVTLVDTREFNEKELNVLFFVDVKEIFAEK
jgi:ERCC4-type nuclease